MLSEPVSLLVQLQSGIEIYNRYFAFLCLPHLLHYLVILRHKNFHLVYIDAKSRCFKNYGKNDSPYHFIQNSQKRMLIGIT